ncbi:Nucleobase-ascorbate transporter-like protein [Quillaja saponaria]|uniref:Nucleobase-ascorbate transporter-like protein n=1 Tax=Quillaja saponaria TaxID=32244 RepID=A0AAD7PLC4_QUISA|nr:Nucleobase-ascorbate transporter-like protein [Quillaja saponaria]
MIVLSVFGKLGAIVASIPFPIMAANHCILYGYSASAGLDFLRLCNIFSFRSKFILGFSLFMSFSIPQYFNLAPVHTGSTGFNNFVQVIFTSPTTVASMIALFLDLTHSLGQCSTFRDSGRKWWEPFMKFNQDSRNKEFYSLPFNLDKFFPPS